MSLCEATAAAAASSPPRLSTVVPTICGPHACAPVKAMSTATLHVLRCRALNKLARLLPFAPRSRSRTLHLSSRQAQQQLPSSILASSMSSSFTTVERGAPNSDDYRLFFKNETSPISPMHDIPLFADEANKTFHMVVEIPRWTNAKMEINLKESLNPIRQDVKNGKLRYVANCFPHHGYIWNYGALPQTWENPEVLDEATGFKGDNDPIDVLEIGYRVAKRGDVLKVKVLGAVALIDEGETDWKIIVIDVNDPLANQMNDVGDIDKHYPGLLKATIEWFKIYKIPDGKPENQFAFNGEAKPRDFALHVIEEVHKHWQTLIKREANAGNISCTNVTLADNSFQITPDAATQVVDKSAEPQPAVPIDPIVDKWHYVHLQ